MLSNKLHASLIFLLLTFAALPLSAQQTTSYLISWAPNPEPDIASYIIYRSTNAGDTNPSPIATVNSTTLSYLDESVLKGVSYYYWLKAVNTVETMSPLSNKVSGLTIPQDASEATQNLCRITQMLKTSESSYEIDWSTAAQTIGFVQYDRDALLDSMSAWDNASYKTSHASSLTGLVSPSTYFMRAVSYDASSNMIISAIDTLVVVDEPHQPLATPHLSIYPVPYRPLEGALNLVDLPEGGSIVILSGDGLEVWSTSVGTETSMAWNGTNNQGSPVMSGVYFAIVRNASGDIVEKRPIMIVR